MELLVVREKRTFLPLMVGYKRSSKAYLCPLNRLVSVENPELSNEEKTIAKLKLKNGTNP